MDEYDYLEAQLEGGPKAEALPPPPPQETSASGKHSEERSRSKDDRHRSSKSRERSRDKRRSRSRSRERTDRGRREPDRDRGDRDRRERDMHDRDRRPDNYRSRDYDRGGDRGGGRDRGYRPYDGGRGGGRDRRDQGGYRNNNIGMPRAPERESTPPEIRLQREKEKEQQDLERTVRTVMVMNLNLKAVDQDVFHFFANVGTVKDIRLIQDKNTKRSKGIAYIEFATVQAAMNALTLNGQVMMGHPVLVKPSEAEKNLAWEAQEQAKKNHAASMHMLNKMGGAAPGSRLNPIKLQILNLHPDVAEDSLKELFAPFGDINYTHVVRDASGTSTGEAYIQYMDASMAENAIKHFNGFELAGKTMLVAIAPLLSSALLPAMPTPGGALPGPPPLPTALPSTASEIAAAAAGAGEVDDLDEAENKSFKLNAQSRQALMSRLASSAGLTAPPSFLGATAGAPTAPAAPTLHVSQQVLLDQGLLGPASPIPTQCLLLKNMFSEADKAEPTWVADVEDDVKGEARKFGDVLHCHVDPKSKGHVYLKFAQIPSAEAASKALHGRYYSGNQIVVSFQFLPMYNQYFSLK